MMPCCTSYFKFLFEWFWGFPQQNIDFVQGLVVWGGTNLSSTFHYRFYMLHDDIPHILLYILIWLIFRFPNVKYANTKHGGAPHSPMFCICIWALLTVFFLVLYWNIFIFRYPRLLGILNLTISPSWSNYKSPLRTILNIFIVLLEILQDLRYTLFVYEKLTFKSYKGPYGVQYYFSPTKLRHQIFLLYYTDKTTNNIYF